jgi:transporter family-2 protein
VKAFMFAFVAVSGVLTAAQAGMNARLRVAVGDPWTAGAWVALVETLLFAVGALVARPALPSWGTVLGGPWWSYVGGVLGVVIVYAGLAYASKLGAGPFNGVLVTAAIIASLLLDHFGLVGFEQHSINLWRVIGGALMVGGVTLIALF